MREILFHGFHPCDGPEAIVVDGEKIEGRWVEGYYVERDNRSWIYPAGNQVISKSLARELRPFHSAKSTQKVMREVFPVLPSTVGQYINVDCFGTKVFEHDVIAVEDEQGEIYRFCVAFGECGGTKNVKHKVGYMGFHFEARDEETKVCMKYGARDDILYWLNAYNCEVIGTVFDEENYDGR